MGFGGWFGGFCITTGVQGGFKGKELGILWACWLLSELEGPKNWVPLSYGPAQLLVPLPGPDARVGDMVPGSVPPWDPSSRGCSVGSTSTQAVTEGPRVPLMSLPK